MASLSVDISLNSSGTQATFTCYYSGLQSGYDGSRRIYYEVGSTYDSQMIYNTSGSIRVTINVTGGNVYGYTFILQYKNKDMSYYAESMRTQGNYTPPMTPYISWFSVSQTSIGRKTASCSWSASSLDGASYVIEAPDTSGRWWTKASGTAYSSGSTTISFDGFGTYQVRLTITNRSGLSVSSTAYVTLTSISKWSWYASNGRASAAQTQNAYNAVVGYGSLANFSYLVWNDMVDKVYSIRNAIGSGWDNSYASYSATCMTASDKTLTATRFNSLRRNTYTGWSAVSRGSIVYGSYFTQIANQINSWIDSL